MEVAGNVIHARSLADIIDLADNPPKDPRALVAPEGSLILYIARVPGSKGMYGCLQARSLTDLEQDVFLTPLKPLQKVVTAADVESSLYYIHLATDDDLRLSPVSQQHPGGHEITPVSSRPAQILNKSVKRKPLASNSLVLDNTSNEDIMAQLKVPGSGNGHASRPIVKNMNLPSSDPRPISASSLDTEHPSNIAMMSQLTRYEDEDVDTYLRRKPVGSGTKEKRTSIDRILGRTGKPSGPRPPHHRHTHSDSSTPALQPSSQKINIDVRRQSAQPLARAGRTRLGSSDATSPPTPDVFCLTLIRRYDGVQSNVGNISAQAHSENQVSEALLASLRIMNPGYEAFTSPKIQSCWTSTQEPQAGSFFSTLRYARILEQARQPLHSGTNPESTTSNAATRSSLSSDSVQVRNNNDGNGLHKSRKIVDENLLRSCQFDSIWGGRCDFSSGISGRSIKCKHTLRPGQKMETFSELRFNLPSSTALGPNPQRPSLAASKSESRRSSFFSTHGRPLSTSSTLENGNACNGPVKLEDRMGKLGLSLGQELAGGGFAGKQAKLGKLIIEPEGLKMLDLVVAANIAVWWKVYEKFV